MSNTNRLFSQSVMEIRGKWLEPNVAHDIVRIMSWFDQLWVEGSRNIKLVRAEAEAQGVVFSETVSEHPRTGRKGVLFVLVGAVKTVKRLRRAKRPQPIGV